ncbi:threonine--tRNA ligase [Candidatus Saccharibacteria bacterium]|nr:threonine--tRNA ligase [Candidatus Saccharibacteria bacterium]MBR2995016.1 threonine--tRNA ligase [Candidatus Saccharibacteria bacterium]MBR2995033.1 threonine--tRNA ligase [Candidatus Saccharibacteria bacterium]
MEDLEKMRHTLSHVLAAAVKELYPHAKFGIGPAINDGFYYDIDFGDIKISDSDLPKIEKKMRDIIARKLPMTKRAATKSEALNWARDQKQDYKIELIEELPEKEKLTFYDMGDLFTDLCKGPHVSDLSQTGPFKLFRVAGAYWRGDEKRPMLTRIYGVAFATKAELDEYLNRQEEAKKRDHRKLGKELDLFCFSDLVGAGLPLFTPRGTELRELMANYSLSLRGREGFKKVWTPHITKTDLYKKSGHYAKFGDELFMVHSQVSGEDFAMKPMNCPHHAQIFASRPRTYREMPVRYMEATTDYRDEKTGELGGLSRVRSLTQDDSHVFCRNDQIKDEVKRLVGIVKELYETMGMQKLRARLSYRSDEDKYLGDKKLWDMAQKQIKQAAIDNGLDYFEQEGEAAFYGPKIDFMAEDAIGREHQLATIQLDFVQPERFGLEFINSKGEKERPVMIHHATLGSIERFLSVFIEHTGGWFPFWCAPEQVRIVTVNDKVGDYVSQITEILDDIIIDKPLKYNELRYTIDDSADSLGKKIRRATEMKIPAILVVGPKDVESKTVSIRLRDKEESIKLSKLADYLKKLK